jgi:hypothetical protein
MNWKLWLKGLFSAVISGPSSAIAAWLALNVVKPELMKGMAIIDTLQLMGIVALFAAIAALVNFLKQTPLPNEEQK